MNRLSGLLIIITSLTLLGSNGYPQSKPPAVYVDKGECPFECCAYREWKTERATTAYARPDKRSKVIGRFKAGAAVVALTGEVHTIPGKFVVFKTHKQYKPGDALFGLYTNLTSVIH